MSSLLRRRQRSNDEAAESQPLLRSSHDHDRFSYRPRSCLHRLAAGTILKSKLRTSEIVKLPYNRFYKYLLIVSILVSGWLFSPNYIPKWLGFFDWRKNNLCPPDRSAEVTQRVHALAHLDNYRRIAARHTFEAQCFEQATAAYFGEDWRTKACPLEDTLQANAQPTEVCIGPSTVSSCSQFSPFTKAIGAVAGICRSVTIPKKCRQSDQASRATQLLKLERERNDAAVLGTGLHDLTGDLDSADGNPVLISTAAVVTDRGSQIISHVMGEADIASNGYIVYSVLGVLVGTPLILFKRSKGSRILDVLFGMRKSLFMVMVVAFLTAYDALKTADINFDVVLRAWKDPCGTLDPRVASAKSQAVLESCSTVSRLAINSSRSLETMDDIYYDARRFAVCQDPANHHPLEKRMQWIRKRFRDGDLSFDGKCNATLLMNSLASDVVEEEAEEIEGAAFKNKVIGLLLGGVIAQLFIKVVFTSWIEHVIAFIDPMVAHSGKVEIWDSTTTARDDRRVEGRAQSLNDRERRSAIEFARDSHLFPLIFLTITICVQVVLIATSLGVQKSLLDRDDSSQEMLDVASKAAGLERYSFQCLVHYP